MWRFVLGVILSFSPQSWRCWYSHSVTSCAVNALDSALQNGPPAAAVPGPLIGLAGLALWLLHPLTWLLGYFDIGGVVRLLAAVATEQIFGTLPLTLIDWSYGKVTGRPPEVDGTFSPGIREQLRSFFATVREKVVVGRLPAEDQLEELTQDGERCLKIHSSRPKREWVPRKVVRIADDYFRLERTEPGKPPRPFVFVLLRLAAGVPGRMIIVYDAPPAWHELSVDAHAR